MNKASLLTVGKKLQDSNLYLLSIYDLEPSGIIVHAYDQVNSKELLLPVSEFEVRKTVFMGWIQINVCHFQLLSAGISRSPAELKFFLDTIELVQQGSDQVLQSTNDKISKIQNRLTGAALEAQIKTQPIGSSDQTINDLIVTGLVELCKVKPVGVDAVKWLGEWLLENNPNKPVVMSPDDE